MTSMPEPSNHRTTDSRLPGTVAEIRGAAVTALEAFLPDSRQQAEDMLLFWRRRSEMTSEDVAAVLDAMFPRPAVGPDKAADWSEERRDGYAEGYLDCAAAVTGRITRETLAAVGSLAARRNDLTDGEREEIRAAIADSICEPGVAREDCPDWCTYDHRTDDARDDLILHMGDDHTDGTVRKLLGADKLEIRVARTDCPSEGTTGTASLMVRCDLELTLWEQAAELARTILDGFGYLAGADR